MISFAVTYTWTWSGNICDQTCKLGTLLGCNNQDNVAALVQQAHRLGVRVLVSLGGAGMGGSWDLSKNRCWDPCLDKAEYLADQVKNMVDEFFLDGVDIDYEDVLDTQQRRDFLRDLTLSLRTRLGPNKLLTHTPMDHHLDKGDPYYQILQENRAEVADAIDLLMPQYYNGFIKSHSEFPKASTHFGNLVDLYDGDASRVVFGFCVKDCGTFNVNAYQAEQVLKQLDSKFAGNGGFFFWSHQKGDIDGSFTLPLLEYYASRDTSSPTTVQPTARPPMPPTPSPSAAPTPYPSVAPTSPPTQTQPQSNAPTAAPTEHPSTDPTKSPTPNFGNPTSAPSIPPTSSSACTIPEWVDEQIYTQGQAVVRHGIRYQAKWWTQHDDPATNNGSGKPWQNLGSCVPTLPPSIQPGVCPYEEWQTAKVYVAGDIVQRQGQKWSAKWWTDSDDPTTSHGSGKPWRHDGLCI